MIYIIMLEPVTPGNVGAVARVMKNFTFDKLVLVNPRCDHLGDESRNRAKHAQEILDGAEVCDFFIVDDYDYLVATTAKVGTDYNISRSPLMPCELGEKLKKIDPSKKIGIVIGREGPGMFNEEIEKCDFAVTIPSAPEYSTLNISHAVAVVLYELHKVFAANHVASHIEPIGKVEKDQILRMFDDVFDGWPWETEEKRDTQEKMWKKILGRSMLTNREAFVVMGFLRKILYEREEKVAGKKLNRPVVSKKPAVARMNSGKAITLDKESIKKRVPSAKGTKRKKRAAKAGGVVAKAKGVKAKKPVAKGTKRKKRAAKAKGVVAKARGAGKRKSLEALVTKPKAKAVKKPAPASKMK